MKDYGVSRRDRFVLEADLLKPLPRDRYELREWREAKVHPDCHIQVKHSYYSVPFSYVGQTVRVKITNSYIEVFASDMTTIAYHQILTRLGGRSTQDQHLPAEQLQASRFEIKKALAQAKAIGPKMFELMEMIFAKPHPLTGLRKAQGILRVKGHDGINVEAMEYAAAQCLTFNKPYTGYFRQCAQAYQRLPANGSRGLAPARNQDDLHLRQ